MKLSIYIANTLLWTFIFEKLTIFSKLEKVDIRVSSQRHCYVHVCDVGYFMSPSHPTSHLTITVIGDIILLQQQDLTNYSIYLIKNRNKNLITRSSCDNHMITDSYSTCVDTNVLNLNIYSIFLGIFFYQFRTVSKIRSSFIRSKKLKFLIFFLLHSLTNLQDKKSSFNNAGVNDVTYFRFFFLANSIGGGSDHNRLGIVNLSYDSRKNETLDWIL